MTIAPRRVTNGFSWKVREGDGDVHRGDDEFHSLCEALSVEGVVGLQECHQVQAGQVATGVVQTHVLTARVGGVDAARLWVGMPIIDRVVVLDPGIGARPGSFSHGAKELFGVDRLNHRPISAGGQTKWLVVLDRAHEQIRDAHGVIGILVLNGRDVLATEVHVEAGVAQHANLLFLANLRLDELLDVGVVNVQHDHFRRTSSGATGLDRPGGCVGAAHERDRAGGSAARGLQQFLTRTNPRQVEARTRTTLEDEALLLVPIQDRFHRVVDRKDEAGADLLGGVGADVEPHRRVEAEDLMQQHVRELVLEDLRVLIGSEVAVFLAGLGVGQDDAVDELLQTPLPLLSADRSAKVLGGDDG